MSHRASLRTHVVCAFSVCVNDEAIISTMKPRQNTNSQFVKKVTNNHSYTYIIIHKEHSNEMNAANLIFRLNEPDCCLHM